MANKIYAFDDFGIKHETMSKTEIENAIQTGEIKKEVFEGSIEYEGENVPYSYVGTKLDDAIILKLLACGISPVDNALIPSEIQTYLSLPIFSIHFYYSETEIYATNAKNTYLGFEKIGIGTCKVYPSGQIKKGYYMKSNKKMNDVHYCETKKEFDDIAKDDDSIYIVDEENYTVDYALEAEHAKKADNANYATNANTAIVSRIPQAITGETKFYPVDQDADYIGLAEENFTLDEVFEKSESDNNKYLPRVKEATNAIHSQTSNDAHLAETANSLYVEQNESEEVQIVNGGTVTTNGYYYVLDDVNKPAIIHFNLDVQLKGVSGLSTAKAMHSESLFYNGTISTGKVCPVAIINESTQTIYKICHIYICYDNSLNKLYAYMCESDGYLSVYLNNVYVSTLELA